MLSEWQKNVDKYIPPQLSGYDFICRVPVYIPVQEIGLTVWERRVQVLSFVQECVLTAIRIGAKSLPDLADQFGLLYVNDKLVDDTKQQTYELTAAPLSLKVKVYAEDHKTVRDYSVVIKVKEEC